MPMKANAAPAATPVVLLDAATLPRIGSSSTVADLKEEAKARGLKVRASSNKQEFLQVLGDGSVSVCRTPQYHYVQAVLALIHTEASALAQRQRALAETQRAEEAARRAEKDATERETIRAHNAVLHTLEAPGVHPHPLAPTAQLQEAPPGRYWASCDACEKQRPSITCEFIEWTCTACDYNICGACFEIESLPKAERAARRQAAAAAETKKRKAREADEEKERKQQKIEREKAEEKALGKFAPHVRDLAAASTQRSSEGYTVWQSDGYRSDGWHSYAGAPRKEFDSCFKTAKDANARAKYLFFVKNTWGLSVEEMLAMYEGSDFFRRHGTSGEIRESYTKARLPPPDRAEQLEIGWPQ
ncbi:hypothetical protein T484DRAFT_1914295 [Baffinella frigidus]|nr:hypothetical protein T484DRAFT_1914295 [Cryptophyta sp. CCMP2293]